MAEMGLDSYRNGETAQAEALDWQLRTAFSGGCAGLFVYAWTDEWFRGGEEVEDWKFGLTDKNREPKPALATVREAFTEVPFVRDVPWPRVSVVICSYNGGRTIRDWLAARTSRHRPTVPLPSASPTLPAAPHTCCSRIGRRNISRGVTWRFANRALRRSKGSIPSSESPGTTWMFAGVCNSRGGHWASARRRWSGIIAATPLALICDSRKATGKPRPCWKGNGRKNTTPS